MFVSDDLSRMYIKTDKNVNYMISLNFLHLSKAHIYPTRNILQTPYKNKKQNNKYEWLASVREDALQNIWTLWALVQLKCPK